jgi:hypothetical protein
MMMMMMMMNIHTFIQAYIYIYIYIFIMYQHTKFHTPRYKQYILSFFHGAKAPVSFTITIIYTTLSRAALDE